MLWLLQAHAEAGVEGGGGEHAAHEMPTVVQFVNHYLGEPVYRFELAYTKPVWEKLLSRFGTTPENVFGAYTPETAIPWYTVMFAIACLISFALIWILKGKLSDDEPHHGQQTLEVGVLAIRGLLVDVVGPHGVKYFPVVATFGILILVSNVMGFFPMFVSPTSSTSVTFALGITSFVYYNYIGIKENGLLGHLGHLAGPLWWIAWLIFPLELISNLVRPFSLGVRLFGNLFADEQVSENIANLYPAVTHWLIPVLLMPLGLFVAFIQTFIFVFLSMVYISEVSHAPHDVHEGRGGHGHEPEDDEQIIAPVLT